MTDDERANEMAQAMYEAFPSPRSVDEENFEPRPWDELTTGARFAWMTRARNLMRSGWVLARKDTPAGAVAEITRIARQFFESGPSFDNERAGLAWGEEEDADDVAMHEALCVLIANGSSTAQAPEDTSFAPQTEESGSSRGKGGNDGQ